MSRASIQAKADKKRGYRKDYAASAAKIEAKGGPKAPSSSGSSSTQTPYDRAKALGYGGKTTVAPGETVAQTYNRGVDVLNTNPGNVAGQNTALKKAGAPGGPVADNRTFNAPLSVPDAPTPTWATTPQASGVGADQGGQFSPASAQSNAAPAYQSLLAALQQTGEERNVQSQQTDAEKELRNLNRGQEQSNRNIADQPIAKPFITGQQAAVAEQYGIDRGGVQDRMQTLQAKLANLQAQRQSSIDVAKTGLDFGKYQDTQARQAEQDQIAAARYQQQLQQQQYENTQGESRYADTQTQQQLDNAYRQAQANKPSTSTPKETPEDKQIAAFQGDAAKYIEQLGGNKVSWGTAFNALKAKYPQASNELIDQTLGKEKYYTTEGNADGGRSV